MSLARRGSWVILGFALLGAALQAVAVRETREPQASVTRTAIAPEAGGQAATPNRIALALRGIPLEVFGLGWFLLIAVLELASSFRSDEQRRRFRGYILAVSVVAVAALAAAAHQTRGSWVSQDVLNLGSAACVIGVFLTAAFSPQPTISDVRGHLLDDVRLMLARPPLWMAAAAMLAVFATRPSPASAASAIPTGPTFEAWYASQPRATMPAPARGVAVAIVKFIDYECGPCKLAHDEYLPMIQAMQKQYPGSIRYVQMDFPLSSECNPFTSRDTHPAACEAAAAVNLAVEAQRDALEAWLWDHQLELTPQTVMRAARDIGQVDNFAELYPAQLDRIRAEVTVGRKMGVNSTPSIFINGIKLRPLPREDLRTAILFELRAAGLLAPGRP